MLSEIAEESDLTLSEGEAFHLLLAIQSNAHRVKDEQTEQAVSLGLFPMTSMMNHSCDPNSFHSFCLRPNAPPVLTMRALKHISSGEELCYSYVPLYQSTAMRQAQLASAYSFTCSCLRCSTAGSGHSPSSGAYSVSAYPCDDFLSVSSGLSGTIEDDASLQERSRLYFRTSSEVSTCSSLLSAAISAKNTGGVESVLRKAVSLCASHEKGGAFHPSNEVILNACLAMWKGCQYVLGGREQMRALVQLGQDELDRSAQLGTQKQMKYTMICVAYTSLALGSLLKFTRVRNNTIANLEEAVGCSLHLLGAHARAAQSTVLAGGDTGIGKDTLEMLIRLLVECPRPYSTAEFVDVFTLVVSTILKQLECCWYGDPRITELLYVAAQYPYEHFRSDNDTLSQAFLDSSKLSMICADDDM